MTFTNQAQPPTVVGDTGLVDAHIRTHMAMEAT